MSEHEWVPFDTILCENESCYGTAFHISRYIYLGIGKYVSPSGKESNGGVPAQLLLSLDGNPKWSSKESKYLVMNYHLYDRTRCR